jgi:crotonobetainyl-CoA:carnitine CoA-transferase CaiB-like acyl-CoA transferase
MLEGVRVVELSAEVGGAFAGRLLATYGADVVVVEPPGGHPVRRLPPRAGDSPDQSILFAYLGAGKRSAVLDLDNAAHRDIVLDLIATAGVVIDSYAPGVVASKGIDPAALVSANPRLVMCSISPFGQSGPRAGWRMTALTGAAAGGQMSVCGDAELPPLKTAGHQANLQAGLHGFSAILAALYAAKASGAGDWLDISMQEVQASTLEGIGPGALNEGSESGRTAGNRPFAQWGIHPCKDGFIGVAAMPRQSYAVYDCIGHPELKDDPAFASGWSPDPNELLGVLIPEWTAERTAAEIFEYAAGFRAPFAMIPGPRELLEWPGLKDVGFWREVDHPVLGKHPLPSGPIQFADGSRGSSRRAPLLGEHTAEVKREARAARVTPGATALAREFRPALDGIRVIDMTAVWAGPYATRFLADMGAEVIKVEGPSFADPVRTMAGARSSPEINQSHYFNEYNRNKEGLSLDVKKPAGMEALKRLIGTADVFIENWSSGVADRLGLSFDDVKAINPRIVYISMPGFGHQGSDADRIGFGPTIEQMGGLVALQGYEGGPPHRSGISYGDPISGTVAAGAIAMLLLNRETTGEASYAVIPQRDAICSLIGEYILAEALGHPLPLRTGSHDPEWAPHNVYQTRDTAPRLARVGPNRPQIEFVDTWLAIAVDSEAAWESFKRVVGDPRLSGPAFATMSGRHSNQEQLDAIIGEWARPLEHAEAAALLQAAGVAASPVLTPLMIANDEHLNARGFFFPYFHADAGECRATRPAWQWLRRPSRPLRAAPRFGEHTRSVLKRLAGYTDSELEAMTEKQVITDDLIPGVAG